VLLIGDRNDPGSSHETPDNINDIGNEGSIVVLPDGRTSSATP